MMLNMKYIVFVLFPIKLASNGLSQHILFYLSLTQRSKFILFFSGKRLYVLKTA